METDEVGAKKPFQYFRTPFAGKKPVDLECRERNVEKEPDRNPRQTLAHEAGQEHQVVIMNPEDVAGLHQFRQRIAKCLVDFPVLLPVLIVVSGVAGEIMEEGPDRLVAEALVEIFHILLREEDGIGVEFPGNARAYRLTQLVADGGSRPSDPDIF